MNDIIAIQIRLMYQRIRGSCHHSLTNCLFERRARIYILLLSPLPFASLPSTQANKSQAQAKMSPTIFFSVVATFIALTTGTSAENQDNTRIRAGSQSQRGFYNPTETGFSTSYTSMHKGETHPLPITQRAAAEQTWIVLDPPSTSTTASTHTPWAWRKPKITPAGHTNPATFTASLWSETPPPQRTPIVDPLLPESLVSVTKTLVTRTNGENVFVDVKTVGAPEEP